MNADDRLVDIADVGHEVLDQGLHMRRHRVPHRVGDVDRRGPGLDGGLHDLGEEVRLGARGVLGRKLDVIAVLAGLGHALASPANDLLLRHLQLVLAMDGAGGEKDVDARPCRRLNRLPGPVDVFGVAAREACDDRSLDLSGDGADSLEVTRRGNREAGLDDVHVQVRKGLGQLELLGDVHAGTGGLLPVAQRGVEDQNTFGPVVRCV